MPCKYIHLHYIMYIHTLTCHLWVACFILCCVNALFYFDKSFCNTPNGSAFIFKKSQLGLECSSWDCLCETGITDVHSIMIIRTTAEKFAKWVFISDIASITTLHHPKVEDRKLSWNVLLSHFNCTLKNLTDAKRDVLKALDSTKWLCFGFQSVGYLWNTRGQRMCWKSLCHFWRK